MKHTTVSAGHHTYAEAFEVAAKLMGTARKDSWRGGVRIRHRNATKTFDVQVPTPSALDAETKTKLRKAGFL
jgi:hypothetical protein